MHRIVFSLQLALAAACMCGTVAAQAALPVGVNDVAWPNASAAGSPLLAARVHYPAYFSGTGVPVRQRTGGWPTIVFLHGYNQLGNDYGQVGDRLAESGFIAVMLNTAQWSPLVLLDDARAMHAALAVANADPTDPLAGACDLGRIGLMGHSMGGSLVAFVLYDSPGYPQNNPGYQCGLSLAPVDPGAPASHIRVPVGIVSGEGDLVTPAPANADPFYQALAPESGIKFHYHMGLDCNHMNVVGLEPTAPWVFERVLRITTGFFGQFLGTDLRGLEPVLGVDGLGDPALAQLSYSVVTPQLWADGELAIGTTTRISLAAEAGFAALLAASGPASVPLPTFIGSLLLDPPSTYALSQQPLLTQRYDELISVPNDPSLVGVSLAMQGAGSTITEPILLGSALRFRLQ